MIIFDTNAVRLINPASDKADLIRKLAASGVEVAVPAMVLEEMVAQKAIQYEDAFNRLAEAEKNLAQCTPAHLLPAAAESRRREVSDYWRAQYTALFKIIPTSGDVAFRALQYEANGLKPAYRVRNDKDGDTKTGARDAAIWLSIIEYLQQNPAVAAYFVTDNRRDFGDGSSWPHPMAQDIAGLEDRLQLLTGWDEFVPKFTEPVEVGVEDQEFLKTPRFAHLVSGRAAVQLRGFLGLQYLGSSEKPGQVVGVRGWQGRPQAAFISANNVSGHKIEADLWYTADTQWMLYGMALAVTIRSFGLHQFGE